MPIIQQVGSFEPVKGQLVYFGRRHGEQTLGKVEKVNRATVKVKQLESRGSFKDHKIGTLWNVARALVSAAPADAKPEGGDWSQDSGGAFYMPPKGVALSELEEAARVTRANVDLGGDFGGGLTETPAPNASAEEVAAFYKAKAERLARENSALKNKRTALPRFSSYGAGPRDPLAARFQPRSTGEERPKRPDAEILKDIAGVYSQLSPENLTCDGELSQAQVRKRARALQGELAVLQREIGRSVTETEAYSVGSRD